MDPLAPCLLTKQGWSLCRPRHTGVLAEEILASSYWPWTNEETSGDHRERQLARGIPPP